ncbi:polysaccharide deacetylase family protein [Clostridium akagii]|uniref:polysaccharide deacetylase family protein n=1 Tax=Clostridium akagii TaxID=91623 RepID=UPI000B0CA7E6
MLIMDMHKSRIRRKKIFITGVVVFICMVVLGTTGVFIVAQRSKANSINAMKQDRIRSIKNAEIIKKQYLVKIEENRKLAAKQLDLEKARNAFNQPPGEFAPWKTKRTDGKKIAYLTFDDGPSENTTSILQILNQNAIKATFFLIGQNAERNADLVKREVNEGNVVGNHTYSHPSSYKEGPQNFLDDVERCGQVLKSILGDQYSLKLMRFPGGYFGHGNRLVPYRDAAVKAGYTYVDWNDETGDAEGSNPPVPVLMNNLKVNTASASSDSVVVLMHDAGPKKNTVQALPEVIQYLKENGYGFETIH